MGTPIKHHSGILTLRVLSCPDVKNYNGLTHPVWHRMLYSCTHMSTVCVKLKGLIFIAGYVRSAELVDVVVVLLPRQSLSAAWIWIMIVCHRPAAEYQRIVMAWRHCWLSQLSTCPIHNRLLCFAIEAPPTARDTQYGRRGRVVKCHYDILGQSTPPSRRTQSQSGCLHCTTSSGRSRQPSITTWQTNGNL